MFRKRKKMKSKILPKAELNIHIILFLQSVVVRIVSLRATGRSVAISHEKVEIAQPVPNIVKESSSLLAMTHVIK